MSKYKIFGFTLAEVLIVLGIIGIVASLTIPQLISNYQKAATVSQLKKTYSMLNQALKASIADNGDVSEWDYVGTDEVIGRKYILPYLRINPTVENNFKAKSLNSSGNSVYNAAGSKGFYLSDGTLISFANWFPGRPYDWSMNYSLKITVDLNGLEKGPNRVGHDIFTFEIPTLKSDTNNRHLNTVLPALYNLDTTYILNNKATNNCVGKNVSTNPYAGLGCAKVIMDDGWQITDRYPWW